MGVMWAGCSHGDCSLEGRYRDLRVSQSGLGLSSSGKGPVSACVRNLRPLFTAPFFSRVIRALRAFLGLLGRMESG